MKKKKFLLKNNKPRIDFGNGNSHLFTEHIEHPEYPP